MSEVLLYLFSGEVGVTGHASVTQTVSVIQNGHVSASPPLDPQSQVGRGQTSTMVNHTDLGRGHLHSRVGCMCRA